MIVNLSAVRYTPYGHASPIPDSLSGFNGECVLKPLEQYFLGAGHRLYSPALMRFFSADIKSPFDEGGFNAYAYCAGDPVNRIDPTGQSWRDIFNRLLGRKQPQPRQPRFKVEVAQKARLASPAYSEPTVSRATEHLPSYNDAFNQLSQSTKLEIIRSESRIKLYQKELDSAQRANDGSAGSWKKIVDFEMKNRDGLWTKVAQVRDAGLSENIASPYANTVRNNPRGIWK
ncbi:RHS repeat-associated core domain-containing protein [Pseudomonas sp. NPDC089743]|uniref:RHS repeat-associated core domain-containing protein n=1 Tax=Pseudomonas sp. NPDC089743 TaxID=3364471 RepID=UPI00381A9369